jgi:hypothetical protein
MAATVLWIEPFGGLAGDMLLAALLDLGDARFALDDLRALAAALVPGECELALTEVTRGALRAKHLAVRTGESAHPPHRHLSDLLELLARAPLSERGRERAAACLSRIAVAEARVHGTTPDLVHFHEVGAVDTLIDVCGAVLALEKLEVERVGSSPPLTGEGTVHTAHGELPVPAPGTAEIARGLALSTGGGPGERLTPTGAALYAELVDDYGAPGELSATAIGYGAGTRDPRTGPPNALRVQLALVPSGARAAPGPSGEAASSREPRTRTVWLLELHLDDATGEQIGHLLEELRGAGALDAWTAPLTMKKGRPGVLVSALARPEARHALERAAFDHSSTLGVRWSPRERTECGREELLVVVEGEPVAVKVRHRPHREGPPSADDLSPEYEDLAALARSTGRSLRELERAAVDAALRTLAGS